MIQAIPTALRVILGPLLFLKNHFKRWGLLSWTSAQTVLGGMIPLVLYFRWSILDVKINRCTLLVKIEHLVGSCVFMLSLHSWYLCSDSFNLLLRSIFTAEGKKPLPYPYSATTYCCCILQARYQSPNTPRNRLLSNQCNLLIYCDTFDFYPDWNVFLELITRHYS